MAGRNSASKKERRLTFRLKPGVRLLAFALLLSATIYGLSRPWGALPPVGNLLSTFHGLWWRTPSPFESTVSRTLILNGLKGRVQIFVDGDQIKHIFAEYDEDLYFAQGFVTASDRLWQMEFLARVAGGRLSEIAGPKTLEMDKFFVKIGLPEAAKLSAEFMLNDELSATALRSYSAGVNAYIQSLDPDRLPFEYRLLGHTPEEWTPYKTALLGKLMAFYLSGMSRDLPLTRSRWLLHRIEFDDLFPLMTPTSEPIIPQGTTWSFAGPRLNPPAREFKPDLQALPLQEFVRPQSGLGSNNWAVSGKRSTTGYPILSNDVHLGLQLPSLWYQVQLSSPTQNTMGVSLVGVPGVMLGFNQHVAWGTTNGYNDILDWYQLRFRDERKSEYLFQGEWRPVISRETEIKVRGQASVKLVLRSTHFGPVVYESDEADVPDKIQRGLAMRWGALEASNELKTFLLLNRAKSVRDCRQALETFNSPDQNILCADSSGSIGIWHMGKYPVKWPGQGRMVLDGTSAEDEWKGWIPRDHVPHSINPKRGYLLSANQAPVDSTYPYYLGSAFMPPYRAMRIGELLRQKDRFSPEDMLAIQGDTVSIAARETVPHLVRSVFDSGETDPFTRSALEALSSWNFAFEETSVAATIYDTWFKHFVDRLWSSRFPDPMNHLYPPLERTVALIATEPHSKWFDDPRTDKKEWLADIARESLETALKELKEKHGSDITKWEWSRHNPTRIIHATRLNGLSRTVSAPGTTEVIYANNGVHGPAWKMVVALGPQPRAWGILPGGQSGDPTSPYYDNDLEKWAKNQFRQLHFMMSAKDNVSFVTFELQSRATEGGPN